MAGVDVWQARLDGSPAEVDAAARLLAPTERAAADDGRPDVRRRRILGRAVLRCVLGRSLHRRPERLRLEAGPYGKPRLVRDRGPALHFSVARRADLVVVAVTRTGPIGVDIEIDDPVADIDGLARGWLAAEELAAITGLSGAARSRAFYSCWARKEAFVKATGEGLTRRLDSFAVTADGPPALLRLDDGNVRDWTLGSLDLGGGLVGAVAVRDRRRRRPRCTPRVMEFHWLRHEIG